MRRGGDLRRWSDYDPRGMRVRLCARNAEKSQNKCCDKRRDGRSSYALQPSASFHENPAILQKR
ncbi:hypothetical protein GCM10023194_22060 [Planotetraspora phitsanulokensis]|uniref:Uncharacterized protein n=1 Tax=Planotetraspora phitsanulokensis TaxID=575192 RepID=A0A8J3U463_9ACTN|nr:hypothetical protein Pph01_32660 [Planotetraspora phitsanulokensis]